MVISSMRKEAEHDPCCWMPPQDVTVAQTGQWTRHWVNQGKEWKWGPLWLLQLPQFIKRIFLVATMLSIRMLLSNSHSNPLRSISSRVLYQMATHSSILPGKIPSTEKPSGLQPMGVTRVRHDWATKPPRMVFNLRELESVPKVIKLTKGKAHIQARPAWLQKPKLLTTTPTKEDTKSQKVIK